MKTRVLALTGTLLLAAAAPAAAGTNTLSGKVTGDSNAKVSMKVKTNKAGVATKVSSIALTNVDYRCETDDASTRGEKSLSVRKSFKVEKYRTRSGDYFGFQASGDQDGVAYEVFGRFTSKKGRKVGGTLLLTFREGPGSICRSGSGTRYSAQRR